LCMIMNYYMWLIRIIASRWQAIQAANQLQGELSR
jgi:hypothetical protein